MSRLHRFTVEGSGRFPLDMLRYDEAWPSTQTDVIAAEDEDADRRQVSLESHREPTPARWKSFLWRVVVIDGAVQS